jgi:formate hydrogenlyase subunit 3/multisubunit Na+/H+ antiporter MnhD subunit
MAVVRREPRMLFVIVYPVIGLLYLVPAIFLWKFAQRARAFAEDRRPGLLEEALDAQRSYWKFMGIMAIIAFVCVVLIFGVGIVAGLLWARASNG